MPGYFDFQVSFWVNAASQNVIALFFRFTDMLAAHDAFAVIAFDDFDLANAATAAFASDGNPAFSQFGHSFQNIGFRGTFKLLVGFGKVDAVAVRHGNYTFRNKADLEVRASPSPALKKRSVKMKRSNKRPFISASTQALIMIGGPHK